MPHKSIIAEQAHIFNLDGASSLLDDEIQIRVWPITKAIYWSYIPAMRAWCQGQTSWCN